MGRKFTERARSFITFAFCCQFRTLPVCPAAQPECRNKPLPHLSREEFASFSFLSLHLVEFYNLKGLQLLV